MDRSDAFQGTHRPWSDGVDRWVGLDESVGPKLDEKGELRFRQCDTTALMEHRLSDGYMIDMIDRVACLTCKDHALLRASERSERASSY